MLNKRRIIGVMGSGQEEHRELVVPLARWIAEHGTTCSPARAAG